MFHIVCWQSILTTDQAVLGSCTSGSASIWSFNQRRALGRPRSWPLAWSNAYCNGDGSSYGWNYMKRLGESTSSYTSYNLGDRLGTGGPITIWEGSGANQWGYRLSAIVTNGPEVAWQGEPYRNPGCKPHHLNKGLSEKLCGWKNIAPVENCW